MLGFRTSEHRPRSGTKQTIPSSSFHLSLRSLPQYPLRHPTLMNTTSCPRMNICHPFLNQISPRYPMPLSIIVANLHFTLRQILSMVIYSSRTKLRIAKDARVHLLSNRKSSGRCMIATHTLQKRSERLWVIGSECKLLTLFSQVEGA